MAAGDNSALGTLASVDKVGQSPADPNFHDVIKMPGDADYKAGGTGPSTAGAIGGLLYALRALRGDNRKILSAKHLFTLTTSGSTVMTTMYPLTYDSVHDKIQCWGGAAAQSPLAEMEDGTNRGSLTDYWEVISK